MSEGTLNVGGENEKFSSALNEILSNPQMLSAISSMAEKLKGDNQSAANTETAENPDTPTESAASNAGLMVSKLPELLGMLSGKGVSAKHNRRNELLCALKPYLSQDRSETIDRIIRLSELSSVLKELS